jgi:hypothetical protein
MVGAGEYWALENGICACALPLQACLGLSKAWGAIDAGSCQARSCSGEETRVGAALGARLGPGTQALVQNS